MQTLRELRSTMVPKTFWVRASLYFEFWLILVGFGSMRCLQAQSLAVSPGHYGNMVFYEPMHLAKGSYTFSACRFEVLPNSIAIAADSGGLLSIENCTFYGSGTGSGIVSQKTMTLKYSQFRNLHLGVYFLNASGPPDSDGNLSNDDDIQGNHFENLDVGILKTGAGKLSIRENHFTNNLTGVQMENGLPTGGNQTGVPIQLNFRCNEFVDNAFPPQVQRVGLKVAANAHMIGGVGGAGDPNVPGDLKPNANVFPVVNRTLPFANWQSPEGWFSVLDLSETGGWKYYRYSNEFVGSNITNPLTEILARRWVKLTDQITIPSGINAQDVDVACGDIFNIVNPFPWSRPSVGNSPTGLSSLQKVEKLTVLDPIPNPAETMVLIGFYIPEGDNRAYLELTDTKGQSIRKVGIIGKGAGALNLPVSNLANGLYHYRLVVDGQGTEWKRLSVQH